MKSNYDGEWTATADFLPTIPQSRVAGCRSPAIRASLIANSAILPANQQSVAVRVQADNERTARHGGRTAALSPIKTRASRAE
jgi:hypothetical protein